LADRLAADGSPLAVGSAAYWRAQERSFASRIASLTRLGARVVTVQIETVGRGIATRCAAGNCGPFIRRRLERTDLKDRWNAFLARYHDPAVRSISIERIVCRDRSSPCDDRLADGSLARPDGSHYAPAAAGTITRTIVDRALAAAGLAGGSTPPRGRRPPSSRPGGSANADGP
jgi:hypothetical protein